jgi:tetratricopeptide (TPR) repeat protein
MLTSRCRSSLLLFLLTLGVLTLGMLVPLVAATAAPDSVVTVGAITGKLSVRRKGAKTAVRLWSGQSLYIGDVISTGNESRASIIFPDGAQVRLNANATMQVTPPRRQRDGKLSLFRVIGGQIWARLRPNNAVETRTAVLGVRGTEILVDVAADETTTLTVTDGTVDFYNEFGAVVVAKDQQSVARLGAAPTAPLTIDNAGFIVEWTLDLDRAIIPRETVFVSLDPQVRRAETTRRAAAALAAPRDAALQAAYGDVLFDNADFEAAIKQFDAALQLEPQNTAYSLRKATALLEAQQLDEAQQNFALSLNGNAPLGADLSQTLATLFNASAAAPQIPAAWQNAAAAPAWSGLAAVALARDRPTVAEKLAALSISSNPDLAAPRLNLGIALLRQSGRLDEAVTALKTVLGKENGAADYQAHAWLSLAYLAGDDRAAALTEAKRAVQLAPQSGLAHGQLGLVYFYSGENDLAAREGKKALQLNPNSVAARVALGQNDLAQGNVEDANRAAAQAVALDPDLPQARYLLGVSDASRRDYRHAIRELQEAIRLAPNYLAARSALARVYIAAGRTSEAEALLTDLLPLNSQTDAVQGALGQLYYEQGRYAESIARYRSALEKNPQSALYNAELTRTLIYANQLQDAIQTGRAAILLAPEVAQYHALLGQAYQFATLTTQAEREYRTALTLDPQNALALAQLAYRYEGTDLRPAAAGFAQSFILDPAIGRQLLRGGKDYEVTPVIGSRGKIDLDATHRLQAADGKLNTFGVLRSRNDDGFRPNSRSRNTEFSDRITYVPSPRTNIYANLAYTRNKNGLPGSDILADLDDEATFKYGQAQLALRQRFGNNHYLWTGLFANRSRNTTLNPNLDSFFDVGTGFAIPRQKFTSKALEPEVRLDLSLDRRQGRKGLLTLGAAKTRTRFNSDRDLQVNPAITASADFDEDADGYLAYAQLNRQFGPKLSLIAHLRYQQIDRDQSATMTLPGGVPTLNANSRDRNYTLPSLLATYLPDKRTTLRLAMNRRVTDVTTSTFAPNETLLTTEASSLPFGIPESVRITQIEAERNVSARGFIKLFAFRSTADNTQIGFSDLLGFGNGLPAAQAPGFNIASWKALGAGVRYEQQLSRYLFTNFGAALRRTTSTASGGIGTAFDDARAPYEPKFLANANLNYRDDQGRRAGIRLRHNGSFFQDTPLALGRSRFGSQTYVDLTFAKEFATRSEVFLNVLNLFDRSQIQFRDYPIGQRQISLGFIQRF